MRKSAVLRDNRAAVIAAAALALFGAGLAAPVAVRAQDETPAAASPAGESVSAADAAEFGEAAPAITALRGVKNKTLVLIFDVSGSMRTDDILRRARTAAVQILRNGAGPGDRVALYTFGAGNAKVFDTTLASRADIADLLTKVPTGVGEGAGTNIRAPHHAALGLIESELPRPGFVVLLTDSFNDEPKPDDPAYQDYLRYYTPGGQLTKYPRTAENRDYERRLASLIASGRLRQFGIGIKIAENGRPIERLPQAAPPPVAAPDTAATDPSAFPAPVPEDKGNGLLPLWLGLAAGSIGVAVFALRPLFATTALRITGGPGGAKDFAVKNGQSVRLGGEGAAAAYDAYALTAAAREPVAYVRGARGGLVLSPAASGGGGAKNPAPTSNPEGSARVFHNGLPLERDAPLRYGDEVRVALPPAPGGVAGKEYRLRFEDPRKSF